MRRFERIFLHVGLHKTGTSTLQGCFSAHRQALAQELSLYYPALDANLSEAIYSAFSEEPLDYPPNIQRGLSSREAVESWNRENLQALGSEFAAADTRFALISGETISYLQEGELSRLCAWLKDFTNDVQVICTLRDPVRWSISQAQSEIRGGATWERVNRRPQHERCRRKLENLEGAFGREAIKLLVFEEIIAHRFGITGAFLEALGFSAHWAEGREMESQNESMSLEAAWLISAVNRQFPAIVDGKPGDLRKRGDVKEMAAETGGQPFALSLEARRRIAEEAGPDLDWLRDRYGVTLSCCVGEEIGFPADGQTFSRDAIDAVARQLLVGAHATIVESQLDRARSDLASRDEQLVAARGRVRKLRERFAAVERRAKNQAELAERVKQRACSLEREIAERESRMSSLLQQLAEFEARLLEVSEREQALHARLEAVQHIVDAMENSFSWKLTRPLRWLRQRLTRLR